MRDYEVTIHKKIFQIFGEYSDTLEISIMLDLKKKIMIIIGQSLLNT